MKKKIVRVDSDRKYVYKYFGAFVSILIVAALLLSGIQVIFSSSLMNQERDSNSRNMFALLRRSHDSLFKQMNNSVATLFSGGRSSYNPYQHFMDYYNEGNYNKIIEIQDQLDRIVTASDAISCICLYYPGYDFTVSTNQTLSKLELYHDAEFLQSLLGQRNLQQKAFPRKVNYVASSGPVDVISVVRTLPTLSIRGIPDAYVVIDLRLSAIISTFSEIYLDNSTSLMILDQAGFPIASVGPYYPIDSLLTQGESAVNELSFHEVKIEDANLFVYDTISSESGWHYIYVQNATAYNSRILSTRNTFLALCLLIVVLGLIFTWFTSRRLYRPIQRISDRLGNSEIDVFDRIDAVVVQNEQMDRSLRENIITGQNRQFVHRMLLNFNEDQNEGGHLRLFESEKCCILYLLHATSAGNQLSEKRLEQVFEHFAMRLICKLYTNYNEIALIIASKELNTDEQLRESAQRITELTTHPQEISIGISKPFVEAGFLADAYHQALEALGMRIVRGAGSICCFREIRNCAIPDYPYRIENAVLRASKTLDVNLVREELKKFEMYLIVQDALARVVKDFYVQLFCSYQHLVMELPINQEGMSELSHMNILGMESIAEMSDYMMDAFAILISTQEQKGSKSELISRICGYIETHLKDAPIVEVIAAEFFMSPSTLRLEFQREMGVSVKNYTDRLRIEQSKNMLTDSNKKIQNIAADLGFNYAQSFIAFFKSSTGMTPGEYRASAQSKKIEMLSGPNNESAASISIDDADPEPESIWL